MAIKLTNTHVGTIYSQTRLLSYKTLFSWYSGLLKPKPIKPPHKHIIQIGDPRLRAVSQPVPYDDICTEKIQRLVKHLAGIFKKYNCIGLSAPQVGVQSRIFIMGLNEKSLQEYSPKERKLKEITLIKPMVIINPEVKILDFKKLVFSESCGSIKGFCADVPRYYSLELKGFNEIGEHINMNATGFTARIIQHEMDHLDGKLYTDSMDRKTLSCTCWEVVNDRNGKVELPYGPV